MSGNTTHHQGLHTLPSLLKEGSPEFKELSKDINIDSISHSIIKRSFITEFKEKFVDIANLRSSDDETKTLISRLDEPRKKEMAYFCFKHLINHRILKLPHGMNANQMMAIFNELLETHDNLDKCLSPDLKEGHTEAHDLINYFNLGFQGALGQGGRGFWEPTVADGMFANVTSTFHACEDHGIEQLKAGRLLFKLNTWAEGGKLSKPFGCTSSFLTAPHVLGMPTFPAERDGQSQTYYLHAYVTTTAAIASASVPTKLNPSWISKDFREAHPKLAKYLPAGGTQLILKPEDAIKSEHLVTIELSSLSTENLQRIKNDDSLSLEEKNEQILEAVSESLKTIERSLDKNHLVAQIKDVNRQIKEINFITCPSKQLRQTKKQELKSLKNNFVEQLKKLNALDGVSQDNIDYLITKPEATKSPLVFKAEEALAFNGESASCSRSPATDPDSYASTAMTFFESDSDSRPSSPASGSSASTGTEETKSDDGSCPAVA